MSCCRRSVSSTPGYTYIKNNVTQTWAALGGVLQPGSIVATSSANNIIVSGNSLVVTNKGTYMIEFRKQICCGVCYYSRRKNSC